MATVAEIKLISPLIHLPYCPVLRIFTKELNFCHTHWLTISTSFHPNVVDLKYFNIWILLCFRSNNLSLKYQRFATSEAKILGLKDLSFWLNSFSNCLFTYFLFLNYAKLWPWVKKKYIKRSKTNVIKRSLFDSF